MICNPALKNVLTSYGFADLQSAASKKEIRFHGMKVVEADFLCFI